MTKANELIPPFATDRYSPAEEGQNCYCARDEVIFNSLQKAFVYACDGAGNYKTFQTINDEAYCIDSDGFPSAGPVSVKNKCDLPCVDRAQCDDNST